MNIARVEFWFQGMMYLVELIVMLITGYKVKHTAGVRLIKACMHGKHPSTPEQNYEGIYNIYL